MWLPILVCLAMCLHPVTAVTRLSIENGTFRYGDETVFLSGVNQAWVTYAHDFGNDQYRHSEKTFLRILDAVSKAGGNSIRVWVHISGESSPHFSSDGMTTGLDVMGTFLDDIEKYLRAARQRNVLVFFVLWNGALSSEKDNWKLQGLLKNSTKLQAYIDNALTPFVSAAKNHPALGGWDIINEPEGMLKPYTISTEPCYNTFKLLLQGAGWAGKYFTMQEIQRFINWQVDAIHRVDPKSLVTTGAWIADTITDGMEGTNYYKKECLLKAGGRQLGYLDFYEVHTYAVLNVIYWDFSPFKHQKSDYGLSEPLIIGEFSQASGAGLNITDQFQHAYNNGYSGAWSWQAIATGKGTDPLDTQLEGINSLEGRTDHGHINIHIGYH